MKSDERLKQTPSCTTTCAMQGLNAPLISLKMTAPQTLLSSSNTQVPWYEFNSSSLENPSLKWRGKGLILLAGVQRLSHLLPVLAGFNTQTTKPNFYVQITPFRFQIPGN